MNSSKKGILKNGFAVCMNWMINEVPKKRNLALNAMRDCLEVDEWKDARIINEKTSTLLFWVWIIIFGFQEIKQTKYVKSH